MKFFIFQIIALLSLTTAAADTTFMTFSGKKTELLSFPNRRLTLSQNCQNQNKVFKCQAYSAFQNAAKLTSKRSTPPEIGEDLCLKTGGKVVTGLSASHDEAPFCYFVKDNSFVDVGSLYSRVRK